MRLPGKLLAALGALLGLHEPAQAQQRAPMPAGPACSTILRVVSVRVTRPDGSPAGDATVRLWPAADSSAARGAQASPAPGHYILFGADAESPAPRQPTRFVVEASAPWADRPIRGELTVGADSAGCFPVLLAGDARLVLQPGR